MPFELEFFSTGVEFQSESRADKLLNEAARLIKASSFLVRVVGYTDEKGLSSKNSELAHNRANKVISELVRRRVEPKYLVGVGRPGGYELSPGAGASSPNRRVQFEMGFRGEERAPQ